MKPYVIKAPEDVSAVAGDEINLACVVGGRPRPEIQWMRENGKFLRIFEYKFCVWAQKLVRKIRHIIAATKSIWLVSLEADRGRKFNGCEKMVK